MSTRMVCHRWQQVDDTAPGGLRFSCECAGRDCPNGPRPARISPPGAMTMSDPTRCPLCDEHNAHTQDCLAVLITRGTQ